MQSNDLDDFRLTSVKFMFLLLKILLSPENESGWQTVPNEEDGSLFHLHFTSLQNPSQKDEISKQETTGNQSYIWK